MSITIRKTARIRRRRRTDLVSRIAIPSAILALGYVAFVLVSDILTPPTVTIQAQMPTPVPAPVVIAKAEPYSTLLDPGYSLGAPAQTLVQAPPPAIEPGPAAIEPEAPTPSVVEIEPDPEQVAPTVQLALPPLPMDRPKIVEDAPRPVPRPSGLNPPAAPERPQIVERQAPRRSRTAKAVPAIPEDNRSFFEKLFGVQKQPAGTALAYAAPQDDIVDASRGRRLSPMIAPAPASAQATAIYDISARMVYMPNGDRLEAHSGLGEHLDNPNYVHLRMRGATPPHTYTLSMREAPFHGVRALRLNPVGGSGAIHGRAGLLAHTYLLGPNGDSNGCVSFKDYERFLQAYLRGEVKRLVVVAGRG
jgi:hypothetical protein